MNTMTNTNFALETRSVIKQYQADAGKISR